MTPFEQAAEIYAADGMRLEDKLPYYRRYGVVYHTDRCFLAAVPVRTADLRGGLFCAVKADVADCWFMAVRTGDISAAWDFEPYPLPFYAFQKRGSRLHIWPRDRIRALTSRHLVAPIP